MSNPPPPRPTGHPHQPLSQRLPFSPYDDVMNPVNKGFPAPSNGPFVSGSLPGRPPVPGNQPGQMMQRPRPPHGTNGFGANMQSQAPTSSAVPWGEGLPVSNFNPVGQPMGPPRPMMPPSSQPINGSNMPPMRPQFLVNTASSNSLPNSQALGQNVTPIPNTVQSPQSNASPINTTGFSQDRNLQSLTDVLPVPFHGQGQYSHQVNPYLLKTPDQTPDNSAPPSAKSSRQPSPVPGSTIDALEGQFSPNSGTSSPAFSGASPVPNRHPGAMNPSPGAQIRPPIGMPGQAPANFPPGSQPFSQQQPGLPPTTSQPGGVPMIQPGGFPLVSSSPLRYPPPPSSQPPPPGTAFPPQPANNGPGMIPPSGQRFAPPPPPAGMNPSPSRFPPPPGMNTVPSRFPPPPGMNTVPTYPPMPPMPSMSQPGVGPPAGTPQGNLPGKYPGQPQPLGYQNNVNAMTQNFGQMGVQDAQRAVNLLNERKLIPPDGVETAKPSLPHDFKKINCNPDVFRCTLNAIPQSSALLTKARLPLGILIHPFRDLSEELDDQLPVIQSSVIVRCRSCRTYINPFVVFVDQRRWKCNLCFRVNELPEEFSFDPVTKTYGDPQRRPEVKSATIEFIAPSEYMLRPPQPAVYLFLLDVSFNAVETGYLSQFCQILLDELDKLPGDARTTVGFMCYDRTLYYFNLAEGLSQPQMLCVPDLEEPFLPCPDNLLVNLHESKELITELLTQLPTIFEGNLETGSALGAALVSAHKMMNLTGGRVTIMQTCLPTVGPGALENRESANTGKNVTNLGPATDFYKKLALDCSAQQIAVDLFMLNGQYADISTLSCISKYSAGSVYHYPSFHTLRTLSLVDKYDADLRRYLTRKIGFESVMRIRCTRGLSIHTFHGNFFVRSTDLLSLPNINPDAGFGMQMSIEDNLNESTSVSFQAALLYTSSKGERRIRVHTLCIPVTNQITDVFASADQQAVAALLAKMAVDRSLNSAISDARDAMINAPVDTLVAYGQQIPASQRVGALMAPYSLRLLPMYMLAMLKSIAFSLNSNTKTDERVFAMQQFKVQPVGYLLQSLYPHLYPLLQLSQETPLQRGKEELPGAPLLQLSSANIDRTGLFLMDCGEAMYLLVGGAVGDQVCQDIFDKPNFMSIPEDMIDLPELENPLSEMIRGFVNGLMDTRPNGITFLVIRDDSKHRHLFFQHMLEDRTENSMSYYEFLQFLQGKLK